MTDTVLKIENLEASYGAVQALRGVSLSIGKGTISTILGANGAGKTTILKCISGIVDPRKGSIHYLGHSIGSKRADLIVRMGIAHVPEGRQVFPLLSVRENLWLGAYTRNSRVDAMEDLEAVYHYFPILKERARQEAGKLSGGQQQMLAIGRAMMARPSLLLMDEPSLGLSPKLTEEIFTIIRRINRDWGTTILLVEQNASIALQTASYGYVLESGRIVMEGACEKLFQDEGVQEFYLGQKEETGVERRRWKKTRKWA
jgi:branched-chain amino acid transport system ATP-binding protein